MFLCSYAAMPIPPDNFINAGVAELADALDLGAVILVNVFDEGFLIITG